MSSLLDDEGEDTFLVERTNRLEEQQNPLFKADLGNLRFLDSLQFLGPGGYTQLRSPRQGESWILGSRSFVGLGYTEKNKKAHGVNIA